MKPGTYTQLYIHLVFTPKYRERLLIKKIRPSIFKYMSGIITKMDQKSIIINGVEDHVHILYGLNPDISISDTVHDIKRNTSLFINKQKYYRKKFAWQEGYGAFSYGKSQLDDLYKYIENQELKHKRKSFKDEYIDILNKFEVDYDDRFLFNFFE